MNNAQSKKQAVSQVVEMLEEEFEAKLFTADSLADKVETREFISGLSKNDKTKELIGEFQALFLSASDLVSTWHRDTKALAPIFSKARTMLKVAGRLGQFSKFLKAIGDFPRTTADRYADAYEKKEGLPHSGADAASPEEKQESADRATRTVKVVFATVADKLAFEKQLELVFKAYGEGDIGVKRASDLLLNATMHVVKQLTDRIAAETEAA